MTWPPTDRPIIAIDASVNFGRPQIRGISTEAIAGMVMAGEGVVTTADEYGLTRHEVVLACWWEGFQGRYRRQWKTWADRVHPPLGGWEPLDVDALPEPPDRDEMAEQRQASEAARR